MKGLALAPKSSRGELEMEKPQRHLKAFDHYLRLNWVGWSEAEFVAELPACSKLVAS